jgi:two-component system phosphate regulon response regulator PhoB
MPYSKILVVEDEPDILELVATNLEREGFVVYRAPDGETGISLAASRSLDLVILDVMLPGMSGLDVFRHLRHSGFNQGVPIVFLTARSDEIDVVIGLELGVDDYITKPFSPRILMARVRSLLRRRQSGVNTAGTILEVPGITLDRVQYQVTVEGQGVALSAMEFSILELLLSSPGKVFSRAQIIQSVQGDTSATTDRSVDVHIVGLRKALGSRSDQIETIRGFGYRLKALR